MSLPLSLFHREFDSIDSKTGGGVGGGDVVGGGGEEREAVEEERREEAEAIEDEMEEEEGLRSNVMSDAAAAGGSREHQESPPVPRLTVFSFDIFSPIENLEYSISSYPKNVSGSVATHSCSRRDLAVG